MCVPRGRHGALTAGYIVAMYWLLIANALADDPPPPPGFGGDVAVGVAGGMLFNDWVTTPRHGAVWARYDAFLVDRTQPGPRLGLSVWGGATLWPLPERTEEDVADAFRYTQYGLMTVFRSDPEHPQGGIAGIGFGRLDLPDWFAGPNYLPTATIEAGMRQRLGERPFLDVLARGHWAQARDISGLGFEEWWMVQLSVSVGFHVE